MNFYLLVWAGYLGVSLVALFAWWQLTRWVAWRALRELLRATLVIILLVPWSVPSSPEHYAPAVVVVAIETFFQENGNPLPALTALLLGAALVNAGLLALRLSQRR